MKSIVLAMIIAFSSAAFTAETTATTAFSNLGLATGKYEGLSQAGKACTVNVLMKNDSVTVTMTSNASSDAFIVLNSASNYSVNYATQELSATQSLNFPGYVRGGTKILNVKPAAFDGNGEVSFFMTNILMDHRGNDMSTYADCKVLL